MNETATPHDASPAGNRRWLYEGIWGLLVSWFRVPRDPPRLPVAQPSRLITRRPARGFLRYLRLHVVVLLAIVDGSALIGGLIGIFLQPLWGLAVCVPSLGLLLLINVIAWLAVELRYDTTWYLISDRTLRLRRGIWLIRETTITFENIQNVSTQQGPLQRVLGIADVIVETAGGGGAANGMAGTSHAGRIEGIEDAAAVRDIIRSSVQRSTSAGLGDEPTTVRHAISSWSVPQLQTLREIRDLARELATERR